MRKQFKMSLALLVLLLGSANSVIAAQVEEIPGAGAMALDLVVARPVGLVVFGLSSVTYLATLPFSLLGGNAGDAGKALVVKPAQSVLFCAWDAVHRVEKSKSPGRGLSNLAVCECLRDGGMYKSLYITSIGCDLANERRGDV